MDIITRSQAREQGLSHYFTGKPCKQGHLAPRHMSTGCVECRKAIKRANYAKNRAVPVSELLGTCVICGCQFVGRTRNQNICSAECRAKKKVAQSTSWKSQNRDRVNARNRAAWADSERKMLMQARIDRYVESNREACVARWKANTQRRIETGEHQMLCGKRRRRLEVNTPEMTAAEKAKLAQFYRVARLMTRRYGVPFEVDHVVPLAKGGAHHPSNLQILTAAENRRKSAKLPK